MASTINAQTSPFAAIVQTADNTGNLAFQTANVTALTIDTSQNVGIGTASPSRQLDVRKTALFDSNGDGTTTNPSIAIGSTGVGFSYIGSQQLAFITNSTEKMRLDSSGNLGLGVTPSSWYTPNNSRALQFNGGSVWSYLTDRIALSQNWYLNSAGTDTYVNTAAASQYRQAAGVHAWFNAPSGTAGTAISFTQAMTLDASGNLLLGQTSSFGGAKFTVNQSNATAYSSSDMGGSYATFAGTNGTGGGYSSLRLNSTSSSSGDNASSVIASISTNASSTDSALTFGTRATSGGNIIERMRITSTGSVGIGTSSPTAKLDVNGQIRNASTADTTPYTQARITAYSDPGNWGYLAYGNDALMRIVYANTANGYPLLFGTTSAYDNTGTFTETMAMTTGGMLVLKGGLRTAGTGIAFPATQSASSDANTLDDYEEGTWSPIIDGTTQTNAGWYVKVGRLVTLGVDNCYASKALATGAQITISNMPFAVSGTNFGGCAASVAITTVSSGYKEYQMSSRLYATTAWTVTNNSGVAITTSDIWNLGASYYASA